MLSNQHVGERGDDNRQRAVRMFYDRIAKAHTPLLTASTPVNAVQPLANDLSNSHTLTASIVACVAGGGTTGLLDHQRTIL
jgi:hypothetical protein